MTKDIQLQVLKDEKLKSGVPMTPELERVLYPKLFNGQPIFTSPLTPPKPGEKVYELRQEDINDIRAMRGAVVDLHPGMGGVVPDKLLEMIKRGTTLTSLDYMVTKGCNFNCPWCFAGSGPTEMSTFIPLSKLEAITQEASDLGTSFFILTGGEPLVYKDPALGKQQKRGDHFFRIVKMIRDTYDGTGTTPKMLTFDDVALITPEIAQQFAENGVGLCTKGDTLNAQLQDYKVNQKGAYNKMQKGYKNLMDAGYGKDPRLRLVVNSVLDQTTLDGMIDLHNWVMSKGFDHSIVPIHYCGSAVDEDQEAGIHPPHVKALYDLIARIDSKEHGVEWKPWTAFPYNKTCNRNRSGLHIRANGDVTSCSESPGREETDRYTFGNVFDENFSLKELVKSPQLEAFRKEFAGGHGKYICSPDVCDLYANNLCQGGCAVRSAYSKMNKATGIITKNDNPHNYSESREDVLCPAWVVLAQNQGVLQPGLMQDIHNRLLERSNTINVKDYPYEEESF
jgi:radical SAM protein with 4Fe4S-binding SPASM domain